MAACDRSQQHQVGHVHRDQQQHAQCAGEEQQQHRLRGRAEVPGKRCRHKMRVPVGIRKAELARVRLQASIERRAGRIARDAGRETSEHEQIRRAVAAAGAERERQQHVRRAIQAERRRQHADDRRRDTVDQHAAADHAGVAIEMPLPERVAQDRRARAVRTILLGAEVATERGRDAECRQQSGVDRPCADEVGLAAAGDVDVLRREFRAEPFDAGDAAEQLVLLRRDRRPRMRVVIAEHDQALRLRERRWRQQYRIDQHEHGDAGADAERERRAGQCQEAWPAQRAAPALDDFGQRQSHVHVSERR